MTVYSTLPASGRTTVLATWFGQASNVSAKVTTLEEPAIADRLAEMLTTLSEATWFSAAWLLTWPDVLIYRQQAVEALRSADDPRPKALSRDLIDWPHGILEVSVDLAHASQELADLSGRLTRPQRLSLADELETETAQIVRAFDQRGVDTRGDGGRAWQLFDVTNDMKYGMRELYGPDAAPLWLSRHFGDELDRQGQWQARDAIVRLLQLEAAGRAAGAAKVVVEGDPLQAKVRFGGDGTDVEEMTVYTFRLAEQAEHGYYRRVSPETAIRVWRSNGIEQERGDDIEPRDQEGFARLVGDWVHAVEMPR